MQTIFKHSIDESKNHNMLSSPTGITIDASESSAISADINKSAFMEIQQPYATSAAMRGSYGQHVQNQVADFYGQSRGLSYPFPSQYSNATNPFSQSFTSMSGIGNYHTPTSTGREGKRILLILIRPLPPKP